MVSNMFTKYHFETITWLIIRFFGTLQTNSISINIRYSAKFGIDMTIPSWVISHIPDRWKTKHFWT